MKPGQRWRPLQNHQRHENSWLTPEHINAYAEQRRFEFKGTGNSAEIQDPHNGGNGEVQTNEETQIYVHDLDLVVTVQILDDAPSLGKLCEEHEYTHEWASGQKPHLTKQGKKILCKTENFSGTSSSSTSLPQDSSSTSSSPATERSDEPAPRNGHETKRGMAIERRETDCNTFQNG